MQECDKSFRPKIFDEQNDEFHSRQLSNLTSTSERPVTGHDWAVFQA